MTQANLTARWSIDEELIIKYPIRVSTPRSAQRSFVNPLPPLPPKGAS